MSRGWLREHVAELAIFCLALSLLFVKLGIGEFEDWDESHIVYRAHVIEQRGAWLDQSEYALGGLYSSAHPPLGIWLMVASRAAFGHSELATRLPAALCGVIAACGIFWLMRRWCGDSMALLLAAAFAAASVFLWYSRHAQLDGLLLATSLLSIALFCEAIERNSKKLAWSAGLVFGLALLSKFGWAFYVLPFVVGLAVVERKTSLLWRFLLIGLALGSSWYVYMAMSNDAFLSSVFGWVVGLSSVKGYETGEKSPIYYLNQLIIACPFVLIALLQTVRNRSAISWIAFSWLAIVLIILQSATTKFPHFALILLPPAFVLTAMGLRPETKIRWIEVALVVLPVLWSLSTQVRLLARGATLELMAPRPAVALPLICCLLLLVLYQFRRRSRIVVLMTTMSGLIVIAAANRVIGYPNDLFDDGAKSISTTLDSRPDIQQVVVVHSGLPFDSLTPRLSYFTKGRGAIKLGWPDSSLVGMLEQLSNEHTAIVLERERDRFSTPISRTEPNYLPVIALLSSRYDHRDSLRSYDLFY